MITRELYLSKILYWMNKPVIKVITGVRRSGKSYLLKMIRQNLIEKKVKPEQIIFINLELIEYNELRSYIRLNDYIRAKKLNDAEMSYVFIDEVQNCDQWERVVASLLAEGNYDLYITGSNASMLSGDLATNIAGRYVEIDMYPLCFSEFCEFKRILVEKQLDKEALFDDYLRYGGFPGLSTVFDESEAKTQYLNGIRNTVVLRDAIQRHQIRDAVQLELVLLYVFDNIGQIFSAKKVADYLKNIGHHASMDSVAVYIKALEDAKIIHGVSRYDIKGKRIMQRLNKYYLCDLGLRYASIGYRNNDIGQMLENVVFMELLSRGYKVYVGKENEYEVDFIAEKGDERQYYQVCYLLATEEVKQREYRSLMEIHDSYPKTVLSMDRVPMGVVEGIRHEYLLDFLTKK